MSNKKWVSFKDMKLQILCIAASLLLNLFFIPSRNLLQEEYSISAVLVCVYVCPLSAY